MWSLLRRLTDFSSRSWLCVGDFNDILSTEEKIGAPPPGQIEEFHSCLSNCQLMDFGCSGGKFTWCNQHETPNTVPVQLDGACATMSWRAMFPHTRVTTKAARGSDHNPLIINLDVEAIQAERVLQRLHSVREGLIGWDRTGFGHVRRHVKDLEDKLTSLDSDPIRADDNLLRSGLHRDLEETLSREEIMWKQQGKAQWLQEGDRNTPFFNARASARKRKNSITRLWDNMGEWCSSKAGIQHIISNYFLNLFRSSNPLEETMTAVLEGMPARVSDDLNEALIQSFSSEELKLIISKLAYELNHYLAHKTCGAVGHATLKLDLNKAYDRVEWIFLERVLVHFGFRPRFVSLVLLCVSSVSYSSILDEALSHLLSKAKDQGELRGVAVSRQGPRVSHFLFTDDILIFCQAMEPDMRCIGQLLKEFEEASGWVVNLDKSSVAFSRNMLDQLRSNLASILGVRIWKRFQSWKCKNLSQAGKMVLLKSVVQAMPTYVMSCFLLPASICLVLESLMADFLWHNKDVRKIHWLSWDKLCASKDSGGLSLRKMVAFNKAMLAEQLWHLISNPTSFLSRMLKQSIIATRDLILAGSRWHIGTGQSVMIWGDRWIPRPLTFQVMSPPNTLRTDATVAEMLEENGDWNEALI
ncbi:UNVERIFIED_CONTAM: hypothetical protein Slati_3123800 [Sesamum latifolium]|uniref:Reverse transcriptase domain-containing protein n=1 Tax=Sesamum latifolium TaxID=2727402 RepID=A0AAW2UV50_9LAMI